MSAYLHPIDHNDLTTGVSLSDEVYARIGAAIVDGSLAPGERLRDVDIATQLGISRTPVREALQRLERFGLVEIAVGRYTRVSVPDERARRETGVFAAYLMGNAIRLALANATDEELDGILAAADAVVDSAALHDIAGLFARCTQMFALMIRATHNTVFIGVVREVALTFERNLRGWDPFVTAAGSRVDLFHALRRQLEARDGRGAEETLRRLHDLH
ncbi:DNA-binding GntR family transcriptional regulator [Microbacterium sp. AG790]|uniref:GntR family transcriptional regulator n=1 Tax=Microbacterium sp. AG790 TaxID=2183995 RepID=UPI000EB59ED5|nr:GntR family transcriptional regulator [Microbacterium sp. AG790]RKS90199.1 DNA-binding GntR family transcriptional regulator [Microbacterium sp. AG790]